MYSVKVQSLYVANHLNEFGHILAELFSVCDGKKELVGPLDI